MIYNVQFISIFATFRYGVLYNLLLSITLFVSSLYIMMFMLFNCPLHHVVHIVSPSHCCIVFLMHCRMPLQVFSVTICSLCFSITISTTPGILFHCVICYFTLFFYMFFCFCRFRCLKSPCPSSFISEVIFFVIIIILFVLVLYQSLFSYLSRVNFFFVYQRLVFFFGYIFGRWKIYPIKTSPQVYNVVDFTIDHETQTTQINPSRT